MAKLAQSSRIVASLFDRLVNDHDAIPTNSEANRALAERRFKAAVIEDLKHLLNTRNSFAHSGEKFSADGFVEAGKSVLCYGLPDMTKFNASSATDAARLCGNVEQALRQFEPRLTDVKVTLVASAPRERTFALMVDARIRLDPVSAPINLQVSMPLTTGGCDVQDGD